TSGGRIRKPLISLRENSEGLLFKLILLAQRTRFLHLGGSGATILALLLRLEADISTSRAPHI
ncbi:MAG: hypothetical protein JSU88_05445, partial [Nitrospinaceae bacterium]